jgi:uncharacterized protein
MKVQCTDARCPGELLMSERQGIEIDYCNRSRAVWLDRGELDKIIERSADFNAAPAAAQAPPPPPQQAPQPAPQPAQQHSPSQQYPPHYGYPKPDSGDFRYGQYGHKRRKSFLSELFD